MSLSFNDRVTIYNDDCFNVFKNLPDKSVDLVLVDPPYATQKNACTSCEWDRPINLEEMWKEIKRIMKTPHSPVVIFGNMRFGVELINSNPKWFRRELIWNKSKAVGFLSAKKQELRKHELIYIFSEKGTEYNPQKTEGKPYKYTSSGNVGVYDTERCDTNNETGERYPVSIIENKDPEHELIYVFSNKGAIYNPQLKEGEPYKKREIDLSESYYRQGRENDKKEYKSTMTENEGTRHPVSVIDDYEEDHELIYIFANKGALYNPQKSEGHATCSYSKQKKNDVADIYHGYVMSTERGSKDFTRYPVSIIEDFEEDHELIYIFANKGALYNPQKTYGHETISLRKKCPNDDTRPLNVYGNYKKQTSGHDDYSRFPTSILKFNNPHKTIHRTQKPVDLCEHLIKTYSNEDDVVLDFCMGSATTGIASIKTNRKFIGVERDEDIFLLAKKRINDELNPES